MRIGRADPGSVDAVFKALSPAIPDRISRGHFGYMMIGRSFTGYDPRRGKSSCCRRLTVRLGGRRRRCPSGSVPYQGDCGTPVESSAEVPRDRRSSRAGADTAGPGNIAGARLALQVKARRSRWLPRIAATFIRVVCGAVSSRGCTTVKTPEDRMEADRHYRFAGDQADPHSRTKRPVRRWGDHSSHPAMVPRFPQHYVSRNGARDDYGVVIDDLTRSI